VFESGTCAMGIGIGAGGACVSTLGTQSGNVSNSPRDPVISGRAVIRPQAARIALPFPTRLEFAASRYHMVVSRRPQLVQLRVENQEADDDSGAQRGVSAGEFSNWLRVTEAALRSGEDGTDVPCGSCRGCCRSSMFIHIGPEEVETIRRIPKGLLFPAPGFPRGHVLMATAIKANARCL
jgi:hypothetical protein